MSIRCDNCGWNNPGTAIKCEKCNQTISAPAIKKKVTHKTPMPAFENVSDIQDKTISAETNVCYKCGYPVISDSEYCPNCGTSMPKFESLEQDTNSKTPVAEGIDASLKGTVRLSPSKAVHKINLKGTVNESSVNIINGALKLVQADNNEDKAVSIISENGSNYLIPLGSVPVYIRIADKCELTKGSEIIIGDRKFIAE